MTTSAYTVRPVEAADDDAVLALLTASLAGGPTGERTREFLHWKHRANPFGTSPGLVAVNDDNAVVAVRLLLRWQLMLGAQRVAAVRAVDTATHPDHQGQGLFRRLTMEALETVASDADLVFNTPNDQSRPGYLKMGWQVVGDVPIALRPVRPLRFLRGLRASGQTAVDERPEPVVSSLPRSADVLGALGTSLDSLIDAEEARAPSDRLRTRRDAAYVRWRYAAAPGLDYRAIVVEDGAGLRGLGLGRVRRRGALVELTLGDVLTRDGDLGAVKAVLRAATRSGVDHVAAHLTDGTPLVAAGRSSGYLRVPGRGLTMTTRVQRPLAVDPSSPTSWALSLGDLEVF